jgi:hypothetical protein
MDDGNNERVSNRLAAQTFMPIMVEAYHDGLREAGSLSRWLLATLVAINGAAAISILPFEMARSAKIGGAGAFLFGILAALGAGLWSLYSFKRVSTAAGTMLGYWLTVADDGPRLEVLEGTMKRHMDQAIGSRGTHLWVIASVAAFLVGCAWTGWGLSTRERSEIRPVEAASAFSGLPFGSPADGAERASPKRSLKE